MSDVFSSPVFSVLAGPDLKPLAAHASILSKSDTLKALVEGNWKDSLDRKIKLEDWDAETVGRCLEWLYSGDYTVPLPESPSVDNASPAVNTSSAEALQDTGGLVEVSTDWEIPRTIPLKAPIPASLTPLADQHFNGVTYQRQSSSLESLEMHIKRNDQRVWLSTYTASLFAHANIYCIASYLLLPELQALAFQNLKTIFLSSDRRMNDSFPDKYFASLITHVYANTSRPESGEEPLQKLLSTMIAVNTFFTNGPGRNTISDLIREGGDPAVNVWSKTSEHAQFLIANAALPRYAKTNQKQRKTTHVPIPIFRGDSSSSSG